MGSSGQNTAAPTAFAFEVQAGGEGIEYGQRQKDTGGSGANVENGKSGAGYAEEQHNGDDVAITAQPLRRHEAAREAEHPGRLVGSGQGANVAPQARSHKERDREQWHHDLEKPEQPASRADKKTNT